MLKRISRCLVITVSIFTLVGCGVGSSGLNGFSSPDLIAIFHLDEGSGNSSYDSSGNGLVGEITGGAAWVDGIKGKAISFENEGAAFRCDYHIPGNYQYEEVSVSAWINPHTIDTQSKYLLVGDGYSWALRIENGKLEFLVNQYDVADTWVKLVSSENSLVYDEIS